MTKDLHQKKMEIVGRLIEKGEISFQEAMLLMETERKTEYIPNPIAPYSPPYAPTIYPNNPWDPQVWYTTSIADIRTSGYSSIINDEESKENK